MRVWSVIFCLLFSTVSGVWSPAIPLSNNQAATGSVFAANNNGSAVVAWVSGNQILANLRTGGVWQANPDVVANTAAVPSQLQVTINGTGIIAIVWKEGTTIVSSHKLPASPSWAATTVLSNAAQEQGVNFPHINMNSQGLTHAVWQSEVAGGGNFLIRSASINLGQVAPVWSAAINVVSDPAQQVFPNVGVELLGAINEAFVIWGTTGTTSALISAFDGAVWGAPTTVSVGLVEFFQGALQIGVGEAGFSTAVWPVDQGGSTHLLQGSFFDGVSWGAPIAVSSNSINTVAPCLSSAFTGDAVVAYEVQSNVTTFTKRARVSIVGNLSWEPEVTLGSVSGSTGAPKCYVNDALEAIASWRNPQNQLFATTFTDAELLVPQQVAINVTGNVGISIDSAQNGISAFQINTGALFASDGTDLFVDPPSPPTNLTGRKNIVNRFLTQSVFANQLNWTASISGDVVSYFIFRNGVQIGTVLAGPETFTFLDSKVDPNVTFIYQVTAVNGDGVQSQAVQIIL